MENSTRNSNRYTFHHGKSQIQLFEGLVNYEKLEIGILTIFILEEGFYLEEIVQIEELALTASGVVNVIFQLDYSLSLEHVVGLSGQVYIFGEDLFFLHILDLSPELDLHFLGWYKLISLAVFDCFQTDLRWHLSNSAFLLQNRMPLTFVFLLLPHHA